jgi:hypothetical protein
VTPDCTKRWIASAHCSGRADQQPGHQARGWPEDLGHGGHVVPCQAGGDGAVRFIPGQGQHVGPQGGDQYLRSHLRYPSQPETAHRERLEYLVDPLAGQRLAQKTHRVPDPGDGPVIAGVVPLFDGERGGRADAEAEAAGSELTEGGCRHGQHRGPSGRRRHDARADVESRIPGGGGGEGRHRIETVGLARPYIGVARVGEGADELAVIGQLHPVQGEHHSQSLSL